MAWEENWDYPRGAPCIHFGRVLLYSDTRIMGVTPEGKLIFLCKLARCLHSWTGYMGMKTWNWYRDDFEQLHGK